MAITVADLEVRARANVGDAQKGLQGVQGAAERSAGGAAGAFRRAGPTIGRAFTAAGAVAGAGLFAATDAAATLADEMANVATVVPTADIAGLTDEVQELSRASGQTTTDLTGGLYDLVSAGVSAEDAMSVLAASTNLAIGGLGSTAGAADVVTSALNAYEEGADQAGRVTDIFALAIQKGKVTADEIGASIANIAPIAASAGIPLEEVGAAYADLTAKGVPAAQATTQMRAAISALLTPNEKLNAIQEQTGINFAELAKEKGLGVAMEELRVAFAENGDAMAELAGVAEGDFPDALRSMQDELGLSNTEVEKLTSVAGKDGAAFALQELAKMAGQSESGFAMALGSVEAYQFALATTGDNAAGFQSTIEEMYGATGTAAEQAAIKMDSPVEAGKRLTATFLTFMQDVGGPFVGTLGPWVQVLGNASGAMTGMRSAATLVGGAMGGLATKIIALATTGVPALIALAAPFAPIILAVGAVVAVVAGLFLAWQNNFLGIRDIAASVWGAVTSYISTAVTNISSFISGLIGFLSTIWNGVTGAASAVWGAVTGFIRTATTNVTNFLRGLVSFVSGIWNGVTGAASAAWGAVTGVVRGAISGITGIIQGIVGVAEGVWNTVSGIFGAIGDAAAGVADFVGGVADAATGWIPSFQTGSMYTPEGPAYLHEGEAVLPPDLAAQFRAFFGGGGGGDERVPIIEAATGGDTNITVNLPGAVRPMGAMDIVRPMRRLATLGTFRTER